MQCNRLCFMGHKISASWNEPFSEPRAEPSLDFLIATGYNRRYHNIITGRLAVTQYSSYLLVRVALSLSLSLSLSLEIYEPPIK